MNVRITAPMDVRVYAETVCEVMGFYVICYMLYAHVAASVNVLGE